MGKNVEQNRSRYRTVAFRCSDSELHDLEKRIELSGLQKQDYILKSVLFQKITVVGNELLFKSLRTLLVEVRDELRRLESATRIDCEQLLSLRTAVEILEGFEPHD